MQAQCPDRFAGLRMLVLGAAFLAATLPGASLVADEARPVAQWVEAIRAEAKGEGADPQTQLLRLGAGVYITHRYHGGDDLKTYRYPEAIVALREFMAGPGQGILGKIVSGEELNGDEARYRLIVQALFLWAGHQQTQASPSPRAFALPLDAGALQRAKAEYTRVVENGRAALRSGYLAGRLTAEEVEAIRLDRIVQGRRGIGECFLPSHLGLHPLATRGTAQDAGHGVPEIERAQVGQQFFDARLPSLAAVRARAGYSDAPAYRYGFEYPLRPEGVLEFIEPMLGYEPARSAQGQPCVQGRKPGGPPEEGWEDLSALIGPKPLLLFMNDGVDEPLLRALELVPVTMQAWAEHADWRFVAVNIHDWHFAAGNYNDYLSRDNWREQHHAWSQEERARRFSMRLVQCPHVDVPALVDSPAHIVKDRYAAGGGQNSFCLIDSDGTIAYRGGGPFRPLGEANAMEHALSLLLASGGKGTVPRQRDLRVLEPARPVAVLHGGRIAAVDADGQTLQTQFSGEDGQSWGIECRLSPQVRIELDGELVDGARLQAGDRVQIRRFLGALGPMARDRLPPRVQPWEKSPEAQVDLAGRKVTMRRSQDGYVADYDLFTILRCDGDMAVAPRLVRAWRNTAPPPDTEPNAALWPRRVTLWRGGRVEAVDVQERCIRVKPWPFDTRALTGRKIIGEHRSRGTPLFLDDLATERLACVERWVQNTGQSQTFRLDDAVDFTVNGLLDGGFGDLREGDAVTIRYECRYDGAAEIRPEVVRISRPPGPPLGWLGLTHQPVAPTQGGVPCDAAAASSYCWQPPALRLS